jgi:hypothetical protein
LIETYDLPHGKRRRNVAHATALTLRFTNGEGTAMDVRFRIFDDAVTFSYYFEGDTVPTVMKLIGVLLYFESSLLIISLQERQQASI